MDGRRDNKGTIGNKGGRPTKAKEQELIERLRPLEDKAFEALKSGLEEEYPWAVKLYFLYRYGRHKQTTEVHSFPEQPLFVINHSEKFLFLLLIQN